MIPSSAEKALLRTRPQSTKLWLSIYDPEVAMAAEISATSPTPTMECYYHNVSQGSYLNVEPGMTMYVGSTPGASDLGKIRVKDIDGTLVTTAENSEIAWVGGTYITIVRFFEINSVFPRITLDRIDPNPDYTTWYKDYDIAYTNQNDVLGSFVCMGSHYAGFLDGGSCQIYYSASGTYNLLGESVTYDWWFEGATVTGSSANTPGFISYNTPGHYTTRLRVTTPTGTYDSSYRHISIYDRPENGTNTPILRWNLKSLSGSREGGGYTAKIAVYEDFSSIKDGALVVIFADDYYGNTKQSIGNSPNRGSIVFVGYIMDGSITVNYQTSALEFEAGSPTEVMKQVESFAVGVNSSSDPANEPNINENIPSSWAVVKDMDCRRAIYHYLRWHSTVLMTNDFEFSGTDHEIEYFDADRESLYDAIQTLMDGTLQGDVVCGKDGKIWAEVGARVTNNAASAFPLNMTLDNQDWRGTARIEEIQTKTTSFLEAGGIYFPGPGNDSVPYLASAPGSAPAYRGSNEKTSGLALGSDQADLNILVGNLFAWKNSRYPSVQLDLSGNYRNFDLAPIERVQMNLQSSDNIRGLSWNAKNFVINGMEFIYDPSKELLLTSVDLHEITQGITGATIIIPEVPPTDSPETGGGFTIPTIQVPPIEINPITITIGSLGTGTSYHPLFVQANAGVTGPTGSSSASPLTLQGLGSAPDGPGGVQGIFEEDLYAGGSFRVPLDYSGDIWIAPVCCWEFWGAGSPTPNVITSYKAWNTTNGNNGYLTYHDTAGQTIPITITDQCFNISVKAVSGVPVGDVVNVNGGDWVTCAAWKPAIVPTFSNQQFMIAGWWIVFGSTFSV